MTHPARTDHGTMTVRQISTGIVREVSPPEAHLLTDQPDFEFVPSDSPTTDTPFTWEIGK